jgi:hypothetical protein
VRKTNGCKWDGGCKHPSTKPVLNPAGLSFLEDRGDSSTKYLKLAFTERVGEKFGDTYRNAPSENG